MGLQLCLGGRYAFAFRSNGHGLGTRHLFLSLLLLNPQQRGGRCGRPARRLMPPGGSRCCHTRNGICCAIKEGVGWVCENIKKKAYTLTCKHQGRLQSKRHLDRHPERGVGVSQAEEGVRGCRYLPSKGIEAHHCPACLENLAWNQEKNSRFPWKLVYLAYL